MDDLLSAEFRKFWSRFFELRHWKHRHLAQVLRVKEDVVSKWVNGHNAPSPAHLSALLEETGLISDADESAQIIGLTLRSMGFSERSLFDIAIGLGGSRAPLQPRDHGGRQEQPRILILSPLKGTSPFYYSGMLAELTERGARSDVRLLVQPVHDRDAKSSLRDYYSDLDELQGVIAINCHIEDSSWLDECDENGIPIALIHDNLPPDRLEGRGMASSIWEDLTGLESCIDHLIDDHGCRAIRVVIANPERHLHRRRKLEAILRRCGTKGVALDPSRHVLQVAQHTYAEGLKVAQRIIRGDSEADAVIALSDEVGLAIWQEAQRRDRPLRVTGYDNTPLAESFDLTSVDHHRDLTARRAIQQLFGTPRRGVVLVPTTFMARSSCCGPTRWASISA